MKGVLLSLPRYVLLSLADTIDMSDPIPISMALFYRGHDIHAKVVLMAKHTETCPYCLITIRDHRTMIGHVVKKDQLDRLEVVRCAVSAPWLMQLQGRGTCTLPPSAVDQLFCRKQTGDLHPITRERTAQKAQAQGLERAP